MSEERFRDWRPPVIPEGKPTEWGWMVRHADRFRLGRLTDIGAFTYIQAQNGVTIEDEVQVGSHCAIYSVSTIDGKAGAVTLRRACRIGSHCVVMPGVTVGEGAIVGACSFVTEDVPAGATAFGVPARVRRA